MVENGPKKRVCRKLFSKNFCLCKILAKPFLGDNFRNMYNIEIQSVTNLLINQTNNIEKTIRKKNRNKHRKRAKTPKISTKSVKKAHIYIVSQNFFVPLQSPFGTNEMEIGV